MTYRRIDVLIFSLEPFYIYRITTHDTLKHTVPKIVKTDKSAADN